MEITQSGLNNIAEYCLDKYQQGVNPLYNIRKLFSVETHFEYTNQSNEWFMNNLCNKTQFLTKLTTEEVELYSVVVILLEKNNGGEPIRVRAFYKGMHSEA